MALLLPFPRIASAPRRLAGGGAPERPARVCRAGGRVKDREEGRVIRVSDAMKDAAALSPLFSGGPALSPPSPSLKDGGDGGEDKQDYYVNMGHAIRTLREEFPDVFYKEPSFDIYRDDIVFKDPLNTFAGIDNYKRIFSALRFISRIFFKALWVDIMSVWQPVENIIMIRWIVHGIPRVPWESRGRIDGISVYKLDKNGKIFEHRVDNVAPTPPTKFRVLAVEELIRSLGCPSTPNPTYFETSILSSILSTPFLFGVAFASCYLAFYLTLRALRCTAEG